MHVSRINVTRCSYYLNNVCLQSVDSYKYLGVHITFNLAWDAHVEYVANNANRMLGYLRRNFHNAPSSLKLLLYKTLVRSKLEYASSVWDPSHDKLTYRLEMVQNNSARFILSNYNRTASITTMKSSLDLPLLQTRRKISRLSLFHKLYHHNELRHKLIPSPSYLSHRIDHAHKVGLNSCLTRTFAQSFIPRTSRDWNHLPAEVVSITDNHFFHDTLPNIA